MSILEALDHYYDRIPDAVAPGWSREPIGLVLELRADGTLSEAKSWLDGRKARIECVPKWFGRSGSGSTPYFLWDNAAYVLGFGPKNPAKAIRDHAAFKELHLAELAGETDAGLHALVLFLQQWTPERIDELKRGEKELAVNLAFQLRGDDCLLHERPAARAHVDRLRSKKPADEIAPASQDAPKRTRKQAAADAPAEGFCLISGRNGPLVRLHPKIKGVDDTASAEVPLVSFNVDAFTSYGKEQGYNAPTSEAAAFRYGAALNTLLARGGRHRLRVGDATVAFWADASALDAAIAEQAARQAEDMFLGAFDDHAPDEAVSEEGQSARVREKIEDLAEGRAVKTLDPALKSQIRFYVLGLSPNAARLSVRFWLEDTFGAVEAALAKHAEDLAIEPVPWRGRPPSVQRLLLKTTALQEKWDNIPKNLAGEVLRSVLTGTAYPRTLLATALMRLRAAPHLARFGWHAAVLKAALNRFHPEEPLPVSLDPDNPSPAYHLGRLFAMVEAAQYAALGRVNASVADRYYNAASSTPAHVFATLIRGARTHIADARKRGRGLWIDGHMQEIINHLPPDLPKSLHAEDQGRFAIGYYHERAAGFAKAKKDENGEEANRDNEDGTQ
ncbi:type I-C CRISPR-associated protein Cas8c/Csd1 [Beijerinckia mobilis]|uniref:type I-C CRISPR-associated protein Cas8c/Csd1 n=1 Tax=Beijerinckia mobilis TaxID=231434 RepID=UPI00054EF727|nr:type I-C CRISPR-associated protein Cas8c/Csd1 [Beijerinckia mobilis]